MFIQFGIWDPSIHDSVDQLKRIASGKKLFRSILEMDKSEQTCIISGSKGSRYAVTLNDCDCYDFSMRGIPCKHIYSLANELGFINDFPELKEQAVAEFNATDEMRRFYSLFLIGAISVEKYIRIAEAIQKGK